MNTFIKSCINVTRRTLPFIKILQENRRIPVQSQLFIKFSTASHTSKPQDGININSSSYLFHIAEESKEFCRDGNFFLVFCSGVLISLLYYNLNEKNSVKAAKPFNSEDVDKYLNTRDGKVNEKPISNREKYNFVADVVEKVAGGVVCIVIRDFQVVDFFTGTPKVVSNGSGFIVSEDGLIITNAHVVLGHERPSLSVRLADGRTFAARIEHVDPQSDLATIRINAPGLKPLPLGRSCDTRLGEWVVALGSPLSLTNTVTAGVVSSVNRGASEIGITSNDIDYIQTDASITFGNSGGPLVNLDGEVIGINSMKVAAGISFAIPIDHAKIFLEKSENLRRNGQAAKTRRYVGLTMLTITDDILSELQMKGKAVDIKRGVIIWRVIVGSPAYFAGLKPGDIILAINDKEVASAADVHEIIQSHDTFRVIVHRNDKNIALTLTPEDIPYD